MTEHTRPVLATVTIKDADDDQGRTIVITEGSDGAARCGLKFNPDANNDVDLLKGLAAGFMEAIAYQKRQVPQDIDAQKCFAHGHDLPGGRPDVRRQGAVHRQQPRELAPPNPRLSPDSPI